MTLTPAGLGVALDLGAHAGVERVDQQDGGAVGDVGLGVGQLGGVAAEGVLHDVVATSSGRPFERALVMSGWSNST